MHLYIAGSRQPDSTGQVIFSPSLDPEIASSRLHSGIIRKIPEGTLDTHISRLNSLYKRSLNNLRAPLPEKSLLITNEMRIEWETLLPLKEIRNAFSILFKSALHHLPALHSTPFHTALSWGDVVAALPDCMPQSSDPSLLLRYLVSDHDALQQFVFHMFLPSRYYGRPGQSYEGQESFLRSLLRQANLRNPRCLDVACGTGESTYRLATILIEETTACNGPSTVLGLTLDPLEAWAAAHASFPHDRNREQLLRERAEAVLQHRDRVDIRFRSGDLFACFDESDKFDLILCNGFMGGPLLYEPRKLRNAIGLLAGLLVPGGILLMADRFHGGWKRRWPESRIRLMMLEHGLEVRDVPEGVGGTKKGLCRQSP